MRELVGPATEVVDLAGGLLVPGFQDAHVHPVMAGVDLLRCDIHHCDSADEALAVIAEYAAAHPDLPWIVGGGWSMEHYAGGTPTRQQLDRVVPDRPAYFPNRDGHGVWVNTRALEMAGITATTPDPADGRIEREADGHPAGTLHEGAGHLVGHLLPQTDRADQLAGLRVAQDHLFSLGITSWQDAAVGEMFGQKDILAVYLEAAASGDLTGRAVGGLWWDRTRSSDQIPDIVDRRGAGGVGRFRPTTVKIMLDGVAENFTAAMLEPYEDGCGCQTENDGLDFVDPVGLQEYVTRLDAAGFQVHFHALGDRAVRHALDALGGRARGQRSDRRSAPPRAPAGRAPRRRPALRAGRRHRQHPGAVGRARGADGRADHPVPRRAPGGVAVPVRRPRAVRRAPRGRQRLVGRRAPTRSTASTSR